MRWARAKLDGLQRRFGMGGRPVPMEPISLRAIAVVRNNVREPRPTGWEHVRSDLIVRDDLLDALDGIEGYSHLIVVFHCHLVPEDQRAGRVRVGEAERGVLATRSQRRPNSLGVAVVPLLRRRHNILRVRGLDAVDGTPVLDIKPYLPHYDSVADARIPDWAKG